MTVTDNLTWFTWIYLLPRKSDALSRFQHFVSMVESNYVAKVGTLQSDRGGEYLFDLFDAFCTRKGILHQLTAARTPHQNGVVERKNRS